MVRVQRAWTSQVRVEKPAGTGNNGGKQEAKRNCEGNSGTNLQVELRDAECRGV